MKTTNYTKAIETIQESAKAHKPVQIQDVFENTDDFTDTTKSIKVNLPDSKASFDSGNGEGIWAQPLTDADAEIAENGVSSDDDNTFLCILLNGSIYYPPLIWGTVIKCKVSSDNTKRPLIDREWFSEVIALGSNNTLKLDDILE